MEHSKCDSKNSASPAVSPWSCFNCRRRKYRCNRCRPCTHCVKSGLQCTYPVSGRMPTRQHGLTGLPAPAPLEGRKELLARLRHLEQFVEEASTQRDAPRSPDNTARACSCTCHGTHQTATEDPEEEKVFGDFGKLYIDKTGCIYVGNEFWALLNHQIKNVREVLDKEDMQGAMHLDPKSSTPFFSGMQMGGSDTVRQPLPSQVPYLWQVYVDNVDSFIKVLHVPSMGKIIKQAKGKFDSLSEGLRALMYAISLAAITALDEIEVQENFDESRESMASWLLSNTERALSDAGVLETTDIHVIQAFFIYLEMAGQYYGSRSIWTMTGVLIRTSMSLGLHRDGSNFSNVSHFNTEMRRRLWWHICFLDHRVGECDVPQLALSPKMFDTREPCNINDEDMSPDMTEAPAPREGFTETSYALALCDLWRLGRKIHGVVPLLISPGEKRDKLQTDALEATEKLRRQIIEETFRSSKPETDLLAFMKYRANALVDQMVLIIRHVHLFQLSSLAEAEPFRQQSFEVSIKSIEDFNKWRLHPSSCQWSWHLFNHNHWHAVCIVFAQLRLEETWNSTSENAWNAAMKLMQDTPAPMMLKNPLRQSVCLLVQEAWKRREHAMAMVKTTTSGGDPNLSGVSDVNVMSPPINMNERCDLDDVTRAWISNEYPHPAPFDAPSLVADAASTSQSYLLEPNNHIEQSVWPGADSFDVFQELEPFSWTDEHDCGVLPSDSLLKDTL
ncbi:unnamed protein product [Clonostachys rosea]|uniref:Zn(2)-C6 fungal-type domain-containing protein n=1 Tax=Bionectria ochroleuca TaxID=29856 RepID=A0ABY6U8N7_BIOOC|nr:unnamed protein product [Clonostachys rosea]